MVQINKETANIYGNIKLAIMTILSILCVCEKHEYIGTNVATTQ